MIFYTFFSHFVALLNFSFSEIVEQSQLEWKFSRTELIRDSSARSALPPPLNLVLLVMWPVNILRVLCGCKKIKKLSESQKALDWRSTNDLWLKCDFYIFNL